MSQEPPGMGTVIGAFLRCRKPHSPLNRQSIVFEHDKVALLFATFRRILLKRGWLPVFMGILACMCCGRVKEKASQDPSRIPPVIAQDIYGQDLSSENLSDKYVYIGFMSEIRSDQVDLVRQFIRETQNRSDLCGIFFINERAVLDETGISLAKDIWFVIDHDRKFRTLLGAVACCDSFYLYDKNGLLYFRGRNSLGFAYDVAPYLASLFNREANRSVGGSKNVSYSQSLIAEIKAFPPIRDYRSDFLIVAILNDICSSCSNGTAMEELDRLYRLHRNSRRIDFLTIVAQRLSTIDRKNLIDVMGLSIPVCQASPALLGAWESFRKEVVPFPEGLIMILNSKRECVGIYDNMNFGAFLERILETL